MMFGRQNVSGAEKEEQKLDVLCETVRIYVGEKNYEECMQIIPLYMERYPDSPVPHNLWGIVKESMGYHAEAMKHFRAAWALDSTYKPASKNMDLFAVYDNQRGREPFYQEKDTISSQKHGLKQILIPF